MGKAVGAVGGGDTEARKALDDLFRIYWKPLYRYVRRTGKSPEDAEDLVQGFFGLLVTGDGLRLTDRERGRFRAFLLAGMKNFTVSEWRREHRQKRGGFATHLSLDWQDAESGLKFDVEDTLRCVLRLALQLPKFGPLTTSSLIHHP